MRTESELLIRSHYWIFNCVDYSGCCGKLDRLMHSSWPTALVIWLECKGEIDIMRTLNNSNVPSGTRCTCHVDSDLHLRSSDELCDLSSHFESLLLPLAEIRVNCQMNYPTFNRQKITNYQSKLFSEMYWLLGLKFHTFRFIFSLNPWTLSACLAMYPLTPAWMRVAASLFVNLRWSGRGAWGLLKDD